jgi:hypothetical protein
MKGQCAWLDCRKPTGLRVEGLCPEHRALVGSSTTSLDAERTEDQ